MHEKSGPPTSISSPPFFPLIEAELGKELETR